MSDVPAAPPPIGAPMVQTQSLEPTKSAERTILITVCAAIALAAAVVLILGLLPWPDTVASERIKSLTWMGVGALLVLLAVVLIQLSRNTGSHEQIKVGLDGVSLDVGGQDRAL